MDIFQVLPCDEGAQCKNSIARAGIGAGKCGACQLSPTGLRGTSFWKPDVPGQKHPAVIAARAQDKKDRKAALDLKNRFADKGKRKLLVEAVRAEKQTERNLIHATRNSGRTNKDGDHVAAGEITLDTKLQSKRDNPIVLLSQITKVGEDARRAGNWMGALVLRNRSGVGVVAMAEADFARLIQRIQ